MDESRLNRRKYKLAQGRIEAGVWLIDPAEGSVKSARHGGELGSFNTHGYRVAAVWDPEIKKNHTGVLLHRVIWEFVHGPIGVDLEINHLDGVKDNNRLQNLETVSQHQNVTHAIETGLWQSMIIGSSREAEIADAIRGGLTSTQIASLFGVGAGTIHRVRSRMTGYQPPIKDADKVSKVCSRCVVDKPVSNFYKRTGTGGLVSYCKACVSVANSEQRVKRALRDGLPIPSPREQGEYTEARRAYYRTC